MKLAKRIYFSPLGYIISYVLNILSVIHKPFMVYGYYNRVQKKFYKNIRISSTCYITDKRKLDISDNVWINHYSRIDASAGIRIATGCQIGFGAAILSHSSHNAIRLNGEKYIELDVEERVGYIFKPVEIGAYSFIGGGSTILPGVTIGKGCVIGVGAVVNMDIPDYAIAVGVPAKIVGNTLDIDKKYFDDERVKKYYYNQESMRSCF